MTSFEQFLHTASAVRTDYAYEAIDGWSALLRKAIESEDGGKFETQVVDRLLGGWQPGHEFLLPAAIRVFGWRDKPPHPQLAQVIAQYTQMMEGPLEEDRYNQLRVLRALRTGLTPNQSALKRDLHHAQHMAERFPDLLPIIADAELLERWRQRYVEQNGKLPDTKAGSVRSFNKIGTIALYSIVGAFALFVLVAGVFLRQDPRPLALLAQLRPGAHLQEAQVREISNRINFRTPPRQLYVAVFRVNLSEYGVVEHSAMIRSSGNPAFDTAADEAIRTSPPFPPDAPRLFDIELGQLGK